MCLIFILDELISHAHEQRIPMWVDIFKLTMNLLDLIKIRGQNCPKTKRFVNED